MTVKNPLVSIITVSLNSEKTIQDTIKSILNQIYPNIEYIIVDGLSNDKTIALAKKFEKQFSEKGYIYKIISERDKGLYDAMNKGIRLATGEIVGFLNSDDYFYDSKTIATIVGEFKKNDIDCTYGNMVYINPNNKKKVVRKWISRNFDFGLFQKSWSPAHPTFYCKRSVYMQLGLYRTDFKIISDNELMYRYLELAKIKSKYINRWLVVMRTGGISNRGIKSIIITTKEIKQAFREHDIRLNVIKYLFFKFLKMKELMIKK